MGKIIDNPIEHVSKFIVCLLMVIVTISSAYALQMDEPQYNPNIIHPGDDVDLWFKITNDDYNNEVRDVRVSIKSHYPFELKQVNPTKGVATITHLNAGESDTVYFKLHVNEEAPSRDYRLDVTIYYDVVEYDNGEEVVTHYEFTKIYYLPVYGLANFEITNSNDNVTLTPAKTQTIPIVIKNKGTGTAKQCTLTINGNDYITPVDTTKFYMGSLNSGESETLDLKLYTNEKTPEGSYLIPATLNWIDEDGTQRTENINIGFVVQGDVLLGISNVVTTPKEIKPGDTYVRIDTTITNNGHGKAKDIQLKLIADYPFKDSWSNANFKDIGTLFGGDSKEVSFYVDVGRYTPPKHYQVPINITYLDIFNKKHSLTKTVDIYIKPKPIVEIIPEEHIVQAGKENTIYITVKNIGNEKGENIKISAIRNSIQPFDYPQKSDIVGTLSPNETGTGAIVVAVDKNAIPKEYTITVELRAVGDREEGDDNVYITQKTVKLKVEKSSTWSLIPSITIATLLIVTAYLYFRRGKK